MVDRSFGRPATAQRIGLLGALLLCTHLGGAGESDEASGLWQTVEGKAVVEVYRCGEEFCGRIVWLKEPQKDGAPVADKENPVDSLRARPVMGLTIMEGFAYDGQREWTGGTIYDPESGDTYSANMILQDERTLELRGYVLIPFFGRSEIWTRLEALPPPAPE
jgi:uncharacterized protein (DUF2147 family)